jgi:hypothetical protein
MATRTIRVMTLVSYFGGLAGERFRETNKGTVLFSLLLVVVLIALLYYKYTHLLPHLPQTTADA